MAFDVRDQRREIAPGYWHEVTEFGALHRIRLLLTFCEENDFPFFAKLGTPGCTYCDRADTILENIKVKKFLYDYNIVGCVGTYNDTGDLYYLSKRIPTVISPGG